MPLSITLFYRKEKNNSNMEDSPDIPCLSTSDNDL